MLGLGLALPQRAAKKAFGLGFEHSDDPGFDSDAAWVKGAGWTVTGSKGVATAASSAITHADAGFLPGTYRVTFDVSGYTAGTVQVSLGSTPVLGTARSANGSYSQDIVATSGGQYGFTATGFTGQVDNLSIRAIS